MHLLKKVIVHPLVILLSFCLIIISGEHYGSFYIWYVGAGLQVHAIHSFLGIIAIFFLMSGWIFSGYTGKRRVPCVLNIISICLMLLSVSLFFYNDSRKYNYGTFYQVIPMLSLVLFFFLSILFFIHQVSRFSAK